MAACWGGSTPGDQAAGLASPAGFASCSASCSAPFAAGTAACARTRARLAEILVAHSVACPPLLAAVARLATRGMIPVDAENTRGPCASLRMRMCGQAHLIGRIGRWRHVGWHLPIGWRLEHWPLRGCLPSGHVAHGHGHVAHGHGHVAHEMALHRRLCKPG